MTIIFTTLYHCLSMPTFMSFLSTKDFGCNSRTIAKKEIKFWHLRWSSSEHDYHEGWHAESCTGNFWWSQLWILDLPHCYWRNVNVVILWIKFQQPTSPSFLNYWVKGTEKYLGHWNHIQALLWSPTFILYSFKVPLKTNFEWMKNVILG